MQQQQKSTTPLPPKRRLSGSLRGAFPTVRPNNRFRVVSLVMVILTLVALGRMVVNHSTLSDWTDYQRISNWIDLPVSANDGNNAATAMRQQQQQQTPFLSSSSSSPLPLEILTNTTSNTLQCPDGFIYVRNILRTNDDDNTKRRIPKIIHQTSKSKCLQQDMFGESKGWQNIDGYSYYFHDDTAIERLIYGTHFPEFPHLQQAYSCLMQGAMKADLWRYIILYIYGGIYADIDTTPHIFNATSITHDDDGFFVVEMYSLLSQYFMAVSPKHPIMYYAIQHALNNIMKESDTAGMHAPFITGPHALHAGFVAFRRDVGVAVSPRAREKPVSAGLYQGTWNHSIRVVGVASDETEYVYRDRLTRKKKQIYAAMNMTHFSMDVKKRSNESCFLSLLRKHSE